jgi:hypothetical protein
MTVGEWTLSRSTGWTCDNDSWRVDTDIEHWKDV